MCGFLFQHVDTLQITNDKLCYFVLQLPGSSVSSDRDTHHPPHEDKADL